jgi:ABC-2 type transport system permease protein
VRLYVELARRSFQRHLAYRAATLAGLFTNAVFGTLISAVYAALYDDRGDGGAVAGFSLPEALTFVWTAQSLIMVIQAWGTWEIAATIQTGDVVTDLMKPYDYYGYWLARDLGRAVCHVLTRFVPTLVFGALLFDLVLPDKGMTWVAFAASMALAVLVSFAVRFLLNLTAFWLTDVLGVRYLQLSVINFLAGFILPFAFFPPALRTVAEILPFRSMVMTPIDVLLGHQAALPALAVQGFWAVVMTLAALGALRLAVRKVVIQGG